MRLDDCLEHTVEPVILGPPMGEMDSVSDVQLPNFREYCGNKMGSMSRMGQAQLPNRNMHPCCGVMRVELHEVFYMMRSAVAIAVLPGVYCEQQLVRASAH